MDALRFLDILGFTVGLVYLYLEYRASIWLWLASVVMPAIDMVLYYKAGLYADFGMAIYYALAAIYGYAMWRWKKNENNDNGNDNDNGNGNDNDGKLPITHFPRRLILPTTLCFFVIWMAIYQLLIHCTDSSVPLQDSFTSALSIVALWALAHKYAEQWLLWIVVDVISSALYVYKDIPFKASLYALYVVIAIFGYRRWIKMIHTTT